MKINEMRKTIVDTNVGNSGRKIKFKMKRWYVMGN